MGHSLLHLNCFSEPLQHKLTMVTQQSPFFSVHGVMVRILAFKSRTLNRVYMGWVCYWFRTISLRIWTCCGGRTQRKPLEQGQEPTTNSTHIKVWHQLRESNPGHNGGRWVLSLLCCLCSPTCSSALEHFSFCFKHEILTFDWRFRFYPFVY